MTRAALLVFFLSCVDSGSVSRKIDRKLVAANLLDQVPSDIARLDVSLGPSAVTYVGNRVELPSAGLSPGQSVRIAHYWRVERAPGPGWRVFGILRGSAGSTDFMYIDPSEMELAHPPQTWQAGEIIQDVHDIVVRPDWNSSKAVLYVGLVRVGGHGISDRMAVRHCPVISYRARHSSPEQIASAPGATDRAVPVGTATEGVRTKAARCPGCEAAADQLITGQCLGGRDTFERAVVAATLDVDLAKAPPPPGTVYVPRASAPLTIDGLGMDEAWAKAAMSSEFLTAEGSPEPDGRTTAKLTWDSERLYVLVQVSDTDIYSPYHRHDEPLWKADAVELFIDADGSRRGYVELQVNPNNATFDSWFATTRAQPGDTAWESGIETAVNVRGTPDRAGDSDAGWSAEIAIPWTAVRGKDTAMQVRIPPRVGDRWRMNVVRVDAKSGRKDIAASSWNRISYRDFHALDRMLTVVFADPSGSIEPVAVR